MTLLLKLNSVSSTLASSSYHALGASGRPYTGFTSSTAQGGGGSFKNRKPIGEVGCCDSGMAERSHWWTERCLRSPLFLSLSQLFSLFLYLSLIIYLPTYWSICLPIYLSVYLSISLSPYLSIDRSIDLSIYLSIYLSLCLSIYLSIYLSLSLSHLSIYLPTYLSIYLSVCLSVCLSTCLSASLKIKLFCEMSSLFKVDNIKNEAILRDFLFELDNVKAEAILRDLFIFQSWQLKKRSNSARLPQFLHLTTSKSKQFCETSVKKWKVQCSADSLVPMRFAVFPLHLSKVLRLPRKSDARSYEVLRLSRKIILANLQIWCSKMQHLAGNQRPDLLTSLMNTSFVAPATENASLQILFKCPTPAIVFGNATKPSRFAHFWRGAQSLVPAMRNELWTSKSVLILTPISLHFWLRNVLRGTTACTFSTSQLPKAVRTWCVLSILTSKCASRHFGVHFFDISPSKSGPTMVCFVHFDFEMCFAPQRRAIFHLSSGQLAPHPPL